MDVSVWSLLALEDNTNLYIAIATGIVTASSAFFGYLKVRDELRFKAYHEEIEFNTRRIHELQEQNNFQQGEIGKLREQNVHLQDKIALKLDWAKYNAHVTTDYTGKIMAWDKDAEELLGWTADEAIGQHCNIIIPDFFRKRHDDKFKEYVESGTKHERTVVNHSSAKRKSGLEIPVSITLLPWMEGGNGDEPRITALIRYETH